MTIIDHGPVLGKKDGWVLFELKDRSTDEWMSLKLVKEEGGKRSYWIGFNGLRLSRTNDTKDLAKQRPDLFDWVLPTAQEYCSRDL